MFFALSPLDGRYEEDVKVLRTFFSETAMSRIRLFVEVRYFIALSEEEGVGELPLLSARQKRSLGLLVERFDEKEMEKVKRFEVKVRHDVKALEYYLRERMTHVPGLRKYREFVHFGLTSEDVSNLAYGILIHQAIDGVLLPSLQVLLEYLSEHARLWKAMKMLSLTHGQPAVPTMVGKEFRVFIERLQRQMRQLKAFRMHGKFGGAVGTLTAHTIAYPDVRWEVFAQKFVEHFGLVYLRTTTQINPHDDLAELSHLFYRIDTILLNLTQDLWLYISRGVFRQKVEKEEVGSSTMPHKVNPIDFENAEGNLGMARTLFAHFAEKLPISRLQRDLSDSTVQRNIGVAFGHHLLAVKSLIRGLKKLSLDERVISDELRRHPEVVAEAIQTVLRKHGVRNAYEQLKNLTRGVSVTKTTMMEFINSLSISQDEKERLFKFLD